MSGVASPRHFWLCAIVLVGCASGPGATPTNPSTASSGSTTASAGATPATAAAPPSSGISPLAPASNWLTFGARLDRRGVVGGGPDPETVVSRWTSPRLDGAVYGQVLVVGSTVIAATEGNSVYGLAVTDGKVLWTTKLGTPMLGSMLPCGNIDPSGITSTPVADPTGATVYVVAFVQPGRHDLVALDTATGAVQWRHPIDPPGLSPLVEQQRSALTLANGRVYVAFGGLFGDCGPFKGAVVSRAADGSGDPVSWIVPTDRQGGIWAPSGPAVDVNGNLYVATGNAESINTDNFDYGNSVVRLTPDLMLGDWWAPQDWAELSATDSDLGSQGPVLIDAKRMFVAGKAGVGYILDPGRLGNIGGETSKLQLCDSAFGGSASNSSLVVVGCSDGLTAATIDGNGILGASWHARVGRVGAPIIAGDVVWVSSNDGHARAFDVATGKTLADIRIADSLEGFPGTTVTPTAVYVTGTDSVASLGAP